MYIEILINCVFALPAMGPENEGGGRNIKKGHHRRRRGGANAERAAFSWRGSIAFALPWSLPRVDWFAARSPYWSGGNQSGGKPGPDTKNSQRWRARREGRRRGRNGAPTRSPSADQLTPPPPPCATPSRLHLLLSHHLVETDPQTNVGARGVVARLCCCCNRKRAGTTIITSGIQLRHKEYIVF